jgi:hypothetical protein
MPKSSQETLTPEKALIFRAIHRLNLPWALANGLHSRSSVLQDPGFVAIGNAEIIARRQRRAVPIEPGGNLADYIPFYFTPYSPMLLNIKTGFGGIQQRSNHDIVILVSSPSSWKSSESATCLPIGTQFLPQPDFSAVESTWAMWTSNSFSNGTSGGTRTIRGSSSAIRPKPWSTSAFRWKP